MYTYPTHFHVSSGKGEDEFKLVAFDNALIDAGISNYNLVKISSILPSMCEESKSIDLKFGSPLLTAFATISSDISGTQLASAVGVGIPKGRDDIGLIMEFSKEGISEQVARDNVRHMVEKAMINHGIDLDEVIITSAEGVVKNGYLSLISAITIW